MCVGLKINPTNQPTNDGRPTTGETTVDRERTTGIWLTNYGLPKKMVKDCIVGSAYTYKVQEGYNGIRKVPSKNYYRYLLSKSSIHFDSMRGKILKKLPLAMRARNAERVTRATRGGCISICHRYTFFIILSSLKKK